MENFRLFLIFLNNQNFPTLTFKVAKFISNNIISNEKEIVHKIIKNFNTLDYKNKGHVKISHLIKSNTQYIID